jgi:outer membrane protein OmpA-like peptidoglycan-associated protein
MKFFLTCIFFFLSIVTTSMGQVFAPLPVQGYNHDVIAEGSGHSSLVNTSMSMDFIAPSNYVICTRQFAKANGLPAAYGIPDNGVIATRRNKFNLVMANGRGESLRNNTLFVRKRETGELKLVTPMRLSMLSILGLATEGPATFTITLHFADFTKMAFRSQNFSDWFDGSDPFYSGFGRIKRVAPSAATPLSFEGAPMNPNFYVIDLSIPRDKILSSVSFQNTSLGANMESNRLFIFALAGVEPKPEEISTPTVKEQKPVEGKPITQPPPSTEIKIMGEVRDAKTNNPISATLQFSGNTSRSVITASDGSYSVTFPAMGEYSIKIESAGYLAMLEKIDLKTSPRTGVNFLLVPIEKGARVNMKNVLFQQGTPKLLDDSFKELDWVADLMKSNPSMRIELAGHTDNVGKASLNLKLSNDRVAAVKKYLVDKGIDVKRIKGKGYGGTKPISPGTTEEARRLNRRVEFIIIEI